MKETDIKLKKSTEAFTIIEVVMVLVILSIISMLVLPKINLFIKSELSHNAAEKICQELKFARELAIYKEEPLTIEIQNQCLYVKDDYKIVRSEILDERFQYRLKSSKSFSYQDNIFKVNENGEWHRYGRIEVYSPKEKYYDVIISSEGRIRIIKRST